MEGLLALSDAMKRVEDPTQRLRFAIQLFGEDAGAKMAPLLEGGRSAIEAYRKELERLGGVVTKKRLADRRGIRDVSREFPSIHSWCENGRGS